MKDTEESVKWRRGHGGDAFQIREQYVQLHKVQDHSAPKGNLSLQAWLQPGVGSMYRKGKRRAGLSVDQCQTLNGMPRTLCSESNREMSQDF